MQDWQDVSDDPDPVEDLGYDLLELDLLSTLVEGKSQVIIMPTDEEHLLDDSFIIVDEDVVCELATMI